MASSQPPIRPGLSRLFPRCRGSLGAASRWWPELILSNSLRNKKAPLPELNARSTPEGQSYVKYLYSSSHRYVVSEVEMFCLYPPHNLIVRLCFPDVEALLLLYRSHYFSGWQEQTPKPLAHCAKVSPLSGAAVTTTKRTKQQLKIDASASSR